MPRAFYHPGVDLSVYPDAQRVVRPVADAPGYGDYSAFESIFEFPPLHLLLIEKFDFIAKLGRECGSQYRLFWSTGLTRSTADAAWNNQDVFSSTTANDLAFDAASFPSDGKYSYAMAASFADLAQPNDVLVSLFRPSDADNLVYLRYEVSHANAGGVPAIVLDPDGGGDTIYVSTDLPAEDEKFVIGFDYDAATKVSHTYINDPVAPRRTRTHTSTMQADVSGYRWRPAGLFGGTQGHTGKFAIPYIQNGVWSESRRTILFNALKAKYSIA